MNIRYVKTLTFIVPGLLLSIPLGACKKQAPAKSEAEKPPTNTRTERPRVIDPSKFQELQRSIRDPNDSIEGHGAKIQKMAVALQAMPVDDLVEMIKSLDPKSSKEDSALLYEAINVLAKRDPENALALAVDLPPQFRPPSLIAKAIAADPEATLRWISQTAPGNRVFDTMALQGVVELVRADTMNALALLNKQSQEFKNRYSSSILAEVAKTDMYEALRQAASYPPDRQAEAMRAAISGGSATDAASAFLELSKLGDTNVAAKVYPNLFARWFDQDATNAGYALAKIPPAEIQKILSAQNGNLSKLITANSELAISILNKVVITEANSGMFMNAAQTLAKNDPEKAMAWMGDFPDSVKKGELMREVAMTRASIDPATAVPAILKEANGYRDQVLDGLATAWGRSNPEEAMKFARNLSTEEQQIFASTVINASIKTNPAAAATSITNSQLPTAVRNSPAYIGAVRSTAFSYAAADLQKAVEWTSSLSPNEQAAAVSGVASLWAERDPNATTEWINKFPAGPLRSAAVLSLVAQIEKSDPESAKRWRDSIR